LRAQSIAIVEARGTTPKSLVTCSPKFEAAVAKTSPFRWPRVTHVERSGGNLLALDKKDAEYDSKEMLAKNHFPGSISGVHRMRRLHISVSRRATEN
jgi:hypothetical protein